MHTGFPGPPRRRPPGRQRTPREAAYCITSLPTDQAITGRLAKDVRGRCHIQNQRRWAHDATEGEVRSQSQGGHGQFWQLAISALRLHGHTNFATALRWASPRPRTIAGRPGHRTTLPPH